MGLVVLALGAVLSGWRSIVSARFSPKAQTAHPAVAFIMVTAMGFGADMGGLMVYRRGVSVEAMCTRCRTNIDYALTEGSTMSISKLHLAGIVVAQYRMVHELAEMMKELLSIVRDSSGPHLTPHEKRLTQMLQRLEDITRKNEDILDA